MGRLDGDYVMLMPIGQFAKASRLSVKSLRNYDESGLLPAQHVDLQSGYRYYAVTQLARADAIRSLRMVDMPLAQIAETLDGEEPERSLMSHLESLQQQRDELNRQAQELQRRIDLKEYVMTQEISIKTHPAQTVAWWRTPTTYSAVFTHIPDGFGRVMTFLAEENVHPVGAPFTVFHQAPDGDSDGDVAMSVPIAASFEPSGDSFPDGISINEIPEGPTASVMHQGSYANMGESYATLVAWITEHGHTIAGPAREVYMNSPADADEADLLTEIFFPISDDGATEGSVA